MPTEPSDLCAREPHLTVSVDLVAGRITLRGDLDRDSVHHLTDAVDTLAATALEVWHLDASAVDFCDAGGLRALARVYRTAAEQGRTAHLGPRSRPVDRLVTLVGLEEPRPASAPAAAGRMSGPVVRLRRTRPGSPAQPPSGTTRAAS